MKSIDVFRDLSTKCDFSRRKKKDVEKKFRRLDTILDLFRPTDTHLHTKYHSI
jgi:hypothetical protein